MDWREPIAAHHEETAMLSPYGDIERGNRWFVDEAGFQRIADGMACPGCLTPFPAPVGIRNLATWRASAFRFAFGRSEGLAIVAMDQCPICYFECSPQMLNAQATRPIDFSQGIPDVIKDE